ncbi:hypothetical protein [Fodinibius salsisoli]|uniref:Alpha-L-arabinofuranosidase 1 catalytic domain-containing protein n=1 Tax=Fodinibius salsisoli TaxID=2820877 RepID=A0ABT3PKT6_9BACT|nr:hypothetical protein [Fodinibius salsisoli]MCW9706512.1 hypothetical protein [Fodinibius salsisoli]
MYSLVKEKHSVVLFILLMLFGCSKQSTDAVEEEEHEEKKFTPIEEALPEHRQSPGFFLDSWKPKQIEAPDYQEKPKPGEMLDSRIKINTETVIGKVPNTVYGNNINPYIGDIHQEPELIEKVKNLSPNIVRMPGGNLSNVFFWDASPGHLPPGVPAQLIDGNTGEKSDFTPWYGEGSWSLDLEGFYEFIEKTGSTPIICVNIGYARYGKTEHPIAQAAHYAAEWVRYDNGRTRYWELGNENYGTWQAGYHIDTSANQDGQPAVISGELYSDIAKVFVDSMRAAARDIGVKIKIGGQLIERKVTEQWETDVVRNWNRQFFAAGGATKVDYYIIHNYYTPYQDDSPPSVVLNSAHDVTSSMMSWMGETTAGNGAEMKPIALTEWNIFAAGSQQMVSDISGMHATMVLGELIKYGYGLAARWNIANGWDDGNDHGMFSLGETEAGTDQWTPRPDFFHMYYFQKYFGDRMVWSGTQGDKALKSYASTFSSGHIGIVVANTASESKVFDVQLKSKEPGSRYYWYTLSGGDGQEAYSRKVWINGEGPSGIAGGPDDYKSIKAYSALTSGQGEIKVKAPPRSVIYLLLDAQ